VLRVYSGLITLPEDMERVIAAATNSTSNIKHFGIIVSRKDIEELLFDEPINDQVRFRDINVP